MDRFISDIHFGHKNILAFDNRPFKSIEEHDEFIVNKWNETVSPLDHTYILGDLSYYNVTKTIELMNSLAGSKTLLLGNHDERFMRNKDFRNCFREITYYKKLSFDDGRTLVLCHYCIPDFDNHYRETGYHFFGHVHVSFEYNMILRFKYLMETLHDKPCQMFNVGIMCPEMEWKPKTFNEIVSAYANKR